MEFFLLGLLIFFGCYFIFMAFKGWNKNHVPKKLIAKVLRLILGYTGVRILVGFIGFVLILPSLFYFIATILPDKLFLKTDQITLEMHNSWLHGNAGQLKDHLKYQYDGQTDLFNKISMKNNYVNTLPDFMWTLKNVKEIDLENNKFKIEYIEEIISKFDSLKVLNIKNNNIDSLSIKNLANHHEKLKIIY